MGRTIPDSITIPSVAGTGGGGGGGAGADTTAFHNNESSEIYSDVTEKSSPVGDDVVLLENSENSWGKNYIKIKDIPSNGVFFGKSVTSSHTLTEDEYTIGVNASSAEISITVPTASTINASNRSWRIKKMDSSTNRVIISLQTPGDAMMTGKDKGALTKQNQGIEMLLNADGKYTFADWSGLDDDVSFTPSVSTQSPSLAGTTLTMTGNVDDMGPETTVYTYFRYRNITDGGDWEDSAIAGSVPSRTSAGSFTTNVTVLASRVYEVQAIISLDNDVDPTASDKYYGAALQTSIDYYSSVTAAKADGVVFSAPLQEEDSGTNIQGIDVIGGRNIDFYNSVETNSTTVGGNTVYYREFGSSDWGVSSFAPALSSKDHTILLPITDESDSGDHTIINFGDAVLSLASDYDDMQLEVNNTIDEWTGAMGLSSVTYLFIIVNRSTNQTILYDVTSSTVIDRITIPSVPSSDASYIRYARGTAGDPNHQDSEYMDDGTIYNNTIWDRVLSEAEMKDIVKTLGTTGGQVVCKDDDETPSDTGSTREFTSSAELDATVENTDIGSTSYKVGGMAARLYMRKNGIGTDGGDYTEDVIVTLYGNSSNIDLNALTTESRGKEGFTETNVDGSVSSSKDVKLDTTNGLVVNDMVMFNDLTNGIQYRTITDVSSSTDIEVDSNITLADNANCCRLVLVDLMFFNGWKIGLTCENDIDDIYAEITEGR